MVVQTHEQARGRIYWSSEIVD